MKNTENKTPVEWLVSRLELDTRFGGIFDEIIGQAKEMEKEQRISDFRAGIDCESDHHGYMWTDKDYPKQWYKELQEKNNEKQ